MAVSLTWSVSVTNTSDTAATVKVVLKAVTNSGSYDNYSPSGYIKIDGTKYTFSHNIGQNTTTTLATKSKSISRTTSSKSVSISASVSTHTSSGTVTKSGSTTVSARPKYTLTFSDSQVGNSTASVYSGYTTTFPSRSKTGYTFNGWTYSGTTYKAGATTPTVTANRTYTASWTKNAYSITYSLGGGTVTTANPTTYYVDTTTFTLHNPTKTGYKFDGWTGSNGTTKQTTVSIAKGSTGNKSYTANYSIYTYSVILNPNGGIVSPTSLTKTYGTNLSLPTPTKENYNFNGWCTAANGSGTNYGLTYTNNSSTTLYAKWIQDAIKITFHYYDNATTDNTSIIYIPKNEDYTLLDPPDIENYKFDGWYTGSNGGGTKKTTINSDSNVVLYAKWIPTCIIQFNSNDPVLNDSITPIGSVASITGKIVGETITLPSLSYSYGNGECHLTGYWVYNNQQYLPGASITIPNNITAGQVINIDAQWAKTTYTLIFDKGEASSSNSNYNQFSMSSDYYSTISMPNKNSYWNYDNHSFSHWESSNGNIYTFGSNFGPIIENETFTARWKSNYTLPQPTVTVQRYSDLTCQTVSEKGKIIQIILGGTSGSYVNVNNPSYSNSITIEFYNEADALVYSQTFNNNQSNQSISETKKIVDNNYTFSTYKVIFKDTTDYNNYIQEEEREAIFNGSIPYKRPIAIHIADNLESIILFDELEEEDVGLVVKKDAFFKDNVFFKGVIDVNDHLIINADGTISVHSHDINSVGTIQINNNINNTDTFYRAYREDTDIKVGFGIGSGGINHGIWSSPLNKWMIYSDGSNTFLNNGDFKITPDQIQFTKDTLLERSGGIDIRFVTKNTTSGVQAWFGIGSGMYNHGIYSTAAANWVIACRPRDTSDLTQGYYVNSGLNFRSIVFDNGYGIYCKDTGGTSRSLALINSSNYYIYGYGSYTGEPSTANGSVYYEGNNIIIASRNGIQLTANSGNSSGTGGIGISGYFKSSLLPYASDTYDLGSVVHPWRRLYLANDRALFGVNSNGTNGENLIMLNTNNRLVIGGGDGIEYLYFNHVSTTSSSADLYMGATNARLYRHTSSSRRFKNSISTDIIKELNPHLLYNIEFTQFKYNDDYLSKEDQRSNKLVPGFIAEQVYEYYPIAVELDEEGIPKDWNVRYIVPPMLALIQEQHKEIEELKQRVQELENK